MKRAIVITSVVITLLIMSIMLISCSNDKRISKTFGIYTKENGQLIISNKHIKAYYKDTHEIELNTEGIKKIKSFKELYMKSFVAKINDKEIYRGKFWSKASSAIYPGVVISDVIMLENGRMKIDFGYPNSQYAKGKDPRNSPEIIDCFKEKGILK